MVSAGLIGLLAAVAGGQDREPPPPLSAVSISDEQRAAARAFMNGVMEPTASSVWNALSFTSPNSEETWTRARDDALALATLGEHLKSVTFAYDQEQWIVEADGLVRAARHAARAAEARDLDDFYAAGDEILATCEPCHLRYLKPLSPPAR
jgi:hypothetical protein